MSRGNPGKLVALSDGRKGIVYNKTQALSDGKLTVHLLDEEFNPVISGHTGKQAIVFKAPSELTLIGLSD